MAISHSQHGMERIGHGLMNIVTFKDTLPITPPLKKGPANYFIKLSRLLLEVIGVNLSINAECIATWDGQIKLNDPRKNNGKKISGDTHTDITKKQAIACV